tara:strand:+ start:121 stop:1359 length:1239 start_codon:yes stop_codon:yes gene_type:complete
MVIRSITFSTNSTNIKKGKKEILIKDFFQIANRLLMESNVSIRTNRLNLNPFSIESQYEGKNILGIVKWLSIFTTENNVRWLAAPFYTFNKNIKEVNKVALEIVKRYENVFVNYILAENNKINREGIYYSSKLIKSLSKLSNNGFENFRFGTLFNCKPNAPYFPYTYHQGDDGFSIALELIPKWIEVVDNHQNSNLEFIRENIIAELTPILSEINDICIEISNLTGAKYYGIDCSLAPFPDNENGSIVSLIEKLGSDGFGSPGTLFITSYLTNIIKGLVVKSRIKSIGFNGVMFSLLEDNLLSQKNSRRQFSTDSLVAYSTVCGCGLDMIPLPGDIFDEEIASIMLDIASISTVLKKPLGVRLLPIPSKKENEFTNFNHDFLHNTRILNIKNRSCSRKIFDSNKPFSYLESV